MDIHKRRKGLVFEGEALEKYKLLRARWIMLSTISCVLPLFLTFIVSCYNGKFQLIELFGQGEIILSLFSLTVPMMFDLFEVEAKKDIYLISAFFVCLFVVVLQVVFYCLIRCDTSNQHTVKGFCISIPFVFASWLSCIYSIKVIARNSDDKVV